jgi:hypothetical protein
MGSWAPRVPVRKIASAIGLFADVPNHQWRTTLKTNQSEASMRAEASFKKVQRAKDAAKATAEYEIQAVATREKTARLRTLRLAKEASDKASQSDK